MFKILDWIWLVIRKLLKLCRKVKLPMIVPKTLFGHNIKEYQNLAAILPKVYAEEKIIFREMR